jgi:hypothetical protein
MFTVKQKIGLPWRDDAAASLLEIHHALFL